MTGFVQVNLSDIVEELGEDRAKAILADFSCPLNEDLQEFLKSKAIEFSRQGVSKTHLVYASYKGEYRLAGYYALATKSIQVRKDVLSKTMQRRIARFGNYDAELKQYILPTILIGQLGKNYADGINEQIKGTDLLNMACGEVRKVQKIIGGKFVYLECEDVNHLRNFYKQNGFTEFGRRLLDKEEINVLRGEELIQLIRYLN